MTDLCSYCKQIPFESLTCPFPSDIAIAHTARKQGQKFRQFLPIKNYDQKKIDQGKVRLGSLSRIQRDSSRCKLCRIFCNVIRRQGSVYMHDKPIPTDDQAIFYAEAKYYGFITVSPLDGEGNTKDCYFYLRRLCLKGVFQDKGTGQDNLHGFAHFANVLQPYQPGRDAVSEDQKMLFGGRIRPQTIDLGLIRRWIEICDTQHEVTCSLEDNDGTKL